jgi:hypothetical protein
MASHARYMEPRLCPIRVNRGHALSSTNLLDSRKTKCRESGTRVMSNRAFARGVRVSYNRWYHDTYLDLRDDLFFGCVGVTTVHDANDVGLRALHKSDRSPKHTLPTAAGIAAPSLSIRRQQRRAGWVRNSPVRMKEPYKLLLSSLCMVFEF